MSSSAVSPAPQWGEQTNHKPPANKAPTVSKAPTIKKGGKRNNAIGVPRVSTEKEKPDSISPAPTASTRSTRSRKNVAYGESDSPDLLSKPLPPVLKITRTRGQSVRMSKSESSSSGRSIELVVEEEEPYMPKGRIRPKESPEIGEVIVAEQTPAATAPKTELKPITPEAEPVKADLPPSTTSSILKISFRNIATGNGGVKRVATSQDPVEEEAPSSYDVTPRVSPTPDAAAPAVNGAAEIQGQELKDAPKRAPRKKRKWLKRGEVDPDDPVAVAKQQERFALLDQADALLEREMQAVRDGTHPSLLALHAQLEVRKDRQLETAVQRHEFKKAEITTAKEQGQKQARTDHHEASENIIDDLRVEVRRKKHAIVNEKLQIGRNSDSYPVLSYGRGSRGWPIHKERLVSNHQQPMVQFEVEGRVRQRKDTSYNLSSISTQDGKADLELFKQRINGTETPPSPEPRRSKHLAKGDPLRYPIVNGPSKVVIGSASIPIAINQVWPKSLYDVKDLPAYQAGSGSTPMRQTPTHSPTPTPSRRPSPAPINAVVWGSARRSTQPAVANGSAAAAAPTPAARQTVGVARSTPAATSVSSAANGNRVGSLGETRPGEPQIPPNRYL